MANIGLLSEITAFGMYLFCMVFTTLISLVVTKCVRPLRGRLLLTPPLLQVTCRWHSTRGYEHSLPSATVSEKGRGFLFCINIQNGSAF